MYRTQYILPWGNLGKPLRDVNEPNLQGCAKVDQMQNVQKDVPEREKTVLARARAVSRRGRWRVCCEQPCWKGRPSQVTWGPGRPWELTGPWESAIWLVLSTFSIVLPVRKLRLRIALAFPNCTRSDGPRIRSQVRPASDALLFFLHRGADEYGLHSIGCWSLDLVF